MTLNDDEFRIWVERQPRGVGQLGFRGAMLKDGPQVAKTVTMSEYGDTSTREVKKRELRFRTAARRTDGNGFAFDEPTRTWACEGGNRQLIGLGRSTIRGGPPGGGDVQGA